jgi:hypothetical protein
MINAAALLTDLIRLLKVLEDDLRARIVELPDLRVSLQQEWQTARDANRTAETFESWSDQVITQAGVHWLLSCVFLRFIEDNQLVERPWFSGPSSDRLALARDRHESYFRANPLESDREYFLACFREAGRLPGLVTFFDEAHNPVFRLGISGDAAMHVLQFWRQIDPNTGVLKHDFADPEWNTRFLGDLYQDLSEATRKRYALLQTPEFVEEFILDRTLTPAINEFGYQKVRMIDPTCGSGHFLLGGFQRLLDIWATKEPGRNRRDAAQRALDGVAGVDLNPFAVAISRFRLLLAALKGSEVHRLADAPDFKIHVAIGDSLLHGKRFGLTATDDMFQGSEHFADTGLAHAYASEDLGEVQVILGRQYHAVVGNPPYIVVKDAALNAAYRKQYTSCHRQYSLGCPFTERFFELAITGRGGLGAGFVGLITANSFMKREFGSKLIEQVLPQLDLTHVVDTSGAYIPGHGTPTAILFGRHRAPVDDAVRTVMGIKGEPSTPDDPAQGLVWSSILMQIDRSGSESNFVSVSDIARVVFSKHPWSISGGGASGLSDAIESASHQRLSQISELFGGTGRTSADDVLVAPLQTFTRKGVDSIAVLPLVEGDQVRDWEISHRDAILTPYTCEGITPITSLPGMSRWLWRTRTVLGNRVTFGNRTYFEEGRAWWGWHQISVSRLRYSRAITFAEIATHNHFVLDRGGKVFKQTSPVINLPAGASEGDHLGLLGLLNSSVACFWLKQVCHNKGSTVDQHGARQRTSPFEDFYAFNSTKVAEFPLIDNRPIDLATRLDTQASQLAATLPSAFLVAAESSTEALPTRVSLDAARTQAAQLRRLMVASQEELDWRCYRLYGLIPPGSDAVGFEHGTPPEVALGERAFEIVLARRMVAGTEQTTWFERHGSTPVTEIPEHWPEDYKRVVQRRIDLIECERNIGLIERPEYKRRWNSLQWETLEQASLRDWLLNRLESSQYWPASNDQPPQLTSTNRLADRVRRDNDLMQIAELYAGHADFDLSNLVAELVANESVPFLPVLRYKDTGMRKRTQWEDTWALQRREDSGENVGAVPVPPKYKSTDFQRPDFWRLRDGLDVPKERWVSFPGCERGSDGSLVIGWAGWDYLQQATALAAYYLDMKENEGWLGERLQPLLAGLLELIPWLKQWHNEYNADAGARMGDYLEGFVADEAKSLGLTQDDLRAWQPIVQARRTRRRANT